MTTYTFKPSSSSTYANWSDPARWTGGVVPNSPDADVDFPIVTYVGSGDRYISSIDVQEGESFAVRSVALRDNLTIHGALSVSGELKHDPGGSITLSGGTLTAGSISNDAYDIDGTGHIVVGTFTNNSQVAGNDLMIDVETLLNTGTLRAGSGTLTINVGAGGFSGLSNGTLVTGELFAIGDGTLVLHASGPITVNAATITLAGGTITSRDPATGQDVALTTSLHTIAPSGTLNLGDRETVRPGNYHFSQLSVEGKVVLDRESEIGADDLVIAHGGSLQGSGTVTSAIENDGFIRSGMPYSYQGTFISGLVLTGPVTGNGTIELLPGHASRGRFDQGYSTSVSLHDATAQNVVFYDNLGVLGLSKPESFTGTISTTGSGDEVQLAGLSLKDVTNVSYSGDTDGGTLTLQQAGSALNLRFAGNHTLSDFAVTAGYQQLSIDPPSIDIRIAASHSTTGQDFNYDGRADLMWLNVDAMFQTWSSQTATGASQDSFLPHTYSNGPFQNWSISDSFDFDGNGVADILWRNTNGAISIWNGTPGVFRLGAYDGTADTSRKIVGAGDFDGDGRGDILFRHDDGAISIWQSTGTTFHQDSYQHSSVGTDWFVEGVGDFDHNGRADIFWRNSGDGAVSIWYSYEYGFQESGYFQAPLGLTWHAQGIGDFDGDGGDDIVWRNDNGTVSVWLGNGIGFRENSFVDYVPDGWNIATVGDYNGDGRDDLMWRNTEGWTSAWNSTGSGWQQGATFDTGVGNDWIIAGHQFAL